MFEEVSKAGHLRKESTVVKYGAVKYVSDAKLRVMNIAKNDVPGLMNAYRDRFKSVEDSIFKSMLWMNPANWDVSDPKHGVNDVKRLSKDFEIPLKESNFSIENIENMWK